jgi:hypothetical protein
MIQTELQNIEIFGEVALPTTDGRTLRFSEAEDGMHGTLQIDISHRDESSEPTDVLQTTILVADATGVLWRAATATTAEFLIRKMDDLSFIDSVPCPLDDAEEDRKALFEKDVLADVRFSSDDRFYRHVVLGDTIREFQFKYTTVHFDLAFETDPVFCKTNLVVRMRKGLFDAESAEEIGSFLYAIDWRGLLRANTAVYSTEYKRWQDSPLPLPLVFSKTGAQGEPNAGITVA